MSSRVRRGEGTARSLTAILVVGGCALALLVSCAKYDPGDVASTTGTGSSAPSSSATTSSGSSESPTSGTPTPRDSTSKPPRVTYTSSLPTGPDTLGGPGGAENTVYQALQRNDCARAQLQLDGQGTSGFVLSWMSMQSPSYVLIFQAAISACEGKLTKAQRWLRRATNVVGLSGVDTPITPTPCYLYKALVSVFSQTPRQTVACPGGVPAQWPDDSDSTTREADPRLDPYPPPASPSTSESSSPSDSSSPGASPSESSSA
jgi:hypothetical protein